MNWLAQIGNWNPQLFRELKGRLKFRNLAIASVLSLLGQLLLVMSFQTQLPLAPAMGQYTSGIYSRYCIFKTVNYSDLCIRDASGNFIINWLPWYQDIFVWLSLFSIFILLIAGVYMLVSDLDREERRGTLNFIRLSPQSTNTILVGKLLGVPILLYIAGLLAIPLHLWSGIQAQIPLPLILSFDGVIAASCACFYSAALLFGLTTNWLGGFQAWLSSGTVFFFLLFATNKYVYQDAGDWINILSPTTTLSALVNRTPQNAISWIAPDLEKLQWFDWSLGKSVAGVAILTVLSYGFWTYWIWRSLNRRFPNPGATMLSKRQSYLLVVGTEIFLLGLNTSDYRPTNFAGLLSLNLLLFLGLIAALTPHRQALHDWARYRHERVRDRQRKGFWNPEAIRDLVWSEKSPALVAIALNLMGVTVILTPWIFIWGKDALMSLVLGANLILIYAAIAQLLLFMKARKQAIWAASVLSAATCLPPTIFALLSLTPTEIPALWLGTAFPAFWSWEALETASLTTIFQSILAQWTLSILLIFKLRKQLQRAGESASKALLAGRPA